MYWALILLILSCCVARQVEGQAEDGTQCEGNSDCQSRLCLCYTCRPRGNFGLLDGNSCITDNQCASRYCHQGARSHCNGKCQSRLGLGGDCTIGFHDCSRGRRFTRHVGETVRPVSLQHERSMTIVSHISAFTCHRNKFDPSKCIYFSRGNHSCGHLNNHSNPEFVKLKKMFEIFPEACLNTVHVIRP